MDKVKNEPAPTITANIFGTLPENHYNLRNYNDFRIPFARTVYHGTESISYLGTKIWDIVPIKLRSLKSVLKNLLEMVFGWNGLLVDFKILIFSFILCINIILYVIFILCIS